VFEQVRKTGTPGLFVLGADVIPDVDGHDRHVVVLVHDHVEAIGHRTLREWQVQVGRRAHVTVPE
jgi:hypothetical protein